MLNVCEASSRGLMVHVAAPVSKPAGSTARATCEWAGTITRTHTQKIAGLGLGRSAELDGKLDGWGMDANEPKTQAREEFHYHTYISSPIKNGPRAIIR